MTMGKNLLVLGGGESGTGSALLGKKNGFQVFLSDAGLLKEDYRKKLQAASIEFEEGGHTKALDASPDTVIKSPGIPEDHSMVVDFRTKGAEVISEIEFASRFTKAGMTCITGSNGKTTTTLLTYHMLKKAGWNVGLAGNVGYSLAAQVAEGKHDHFVVELSSFQLDGMFQFRANQAILLNITPDHLDRYENKLENYAASKFRVVRNQTPDDVMIYCADDEVTQQHLDQYPTPALKIPFSIKKKLPLGAYLDQNQIVIQLPKTQFTMSIFELALQGKHNIYNSMAAAVTGSVLNLRKEVIRESLADFKNVEHRLEFVATVYGVDYINDSKATNVNSTWYALESINRPVILILGGKDKGNDYSMLVALVKEKVKAIVCLGLDNRKIHKAFKDVTPVIVDTLSAEDAVRVATGLGKKGDVVLLSPACASFDLFQNYEERGRKFKTAVKAL